MKEDKTITFFLLSDYKEVLELWRATAWGRGKLQTFFSFERCFMCSQITSEQLLLVTKTLHWRGENIPYCIETPHVTRHRLLKMDSIYIFISLVKHPGTRTRTHTFPLLPHYISQHQECSDDVPTLIKPPELGNCSVLSVGKSEAGNLTTFDRMQQNVSGSWGWRRVASCMTFGQASNVCRVTTDMRVAIRL